MPRRKAKRTTRRRGSSAFNLKNALLSYASLHIMSQNITGLSPWNFLTAGTRLNPSVGEWGTAPQVGGHYEKITLQEIINGIQTGSGGGDANMNPIGAMGDNLRSNILPMILSLAGIKIAGKVITKLGVSRQFNSLARSVGVGSMVRM